MPYGTDPFVDGYGDYKQPTIIDYDKKIATLNSNSNNILSDEERQLIFDQFKKDQEEALQEIYNTNPLYGGEKYQHLVFASDNKLVWDKTKIEAQKEDVDWLYTFLRFLKKRKKSLIYT